MTAVVFVDLRRVLLCCPTLEDFIALHPDAAGSMDDACAVIAALAGIHRSVQSRLQLASLSTAHGCPPTMTKDPADGVVVEIAGADRIDVLAAYSDGAFAWYDGASERLTEAKASPALRPVIDRLFMAVAAADRPFGPPRPQLPPVPEPGQMTISRITIGGVAFANGPSAAMASDKYAGPIVHWGLQLADQLKG